MVKRKSTEPFIVETPNKYISVDSEVRTLPSYLPPSPFLTRSHVGLVSCPNSSPRQVSRSAPIPSPRPSSCTSPYPSFSSIPNLFSAQLPTPLRVPLLVALPFNYHTQRPLGDYMLHRFSR